MRNVVIVGGGQAGFSVASKLRGLGFEGSVTLVCDEPRPPYQRPPLSKKYLLGELDEARLYLRPPDFYREQGIDLRLGAECAEVDRSKRRVAVGGEQLPYSDLVIATGSVPRSLPRVIGGALRGVHTVRTIADIDSMALRFKPESRMLVVGGGYIGLEAASAAATKGLSVTVVEIADRILQRVAAPETSDLFRRLHSSHGVELLEGVGLKRLLGEKVLEGAELSDGTRIGLDLAIAGIGIEPATGLAEAAGLAIENGIRIDSKGRTSDPSIWAAGDCCSFPWQGRRIRLESVQNAIDQAELVAENIMGADKDYNPTPWFWSDQYDAKLQIAGLGTGYDRIVVRPGADDTAASHWYFCGDRFLAVDAVNDPRSYMVAKRLLEMGRNVDPDAVSDPATNLKALLRSS